MVACKVCKSNINIRIKECESGGVAYHPKCFRCSICNRFCSEYDVKIRGRKLFCSYHGSHIKGFQPLCKIYYNNLAACYRIIYAADNGKTKRSAKG